MDDSSLGYRCGMGFVVSTTAGLASSIGLEAIQDSMRDAYSMIQNFGELEGLKPYWDLFKISSHLMFGSILSKKGGEGLFKAVDIVSGESELKPQKSPREKKASFLERARSKGLI